ncbi:hypothetical protein TNCV_1258791 [Trichonephila clavipes]|nr:hypothetical protein TNCV_1258791 [Trichonephila clavipes]
MPYFQGLTDVLFQQESERTNVALVLTYFITECVRLSLRQQHILQISHLSKTSGHGVMRNCTTTVLQHYALRRLDWWCRAGRGNAVKTRRVEQAVVSRPLPKNYSSRSYESSLDGAASECSNK